MLLFHTCRWPGCSELCCVLKRSFVISSAPLWYTARPTHRGFARGCCHARPVSLQLRQMTQTHAAFAALCALALCRCTRASIEEAPFFGEVSTLLSEETLELARQAAQQPQRFATAVMSAPRDDSSAALGTTLAGLFGSGVHEVHVTWGRYEESGRPPAHVSAVLKHFVGSGLGRVHLHMMPRELWHWYRPGER